MKIASVRAIPLAGTVDKPIWFGGGAFPTFYATLVEIRTDDGGRGVGECIARKPQKLPRRSSSRSSLRCWPAGIRAMSKACGTTCSHSCGGGDTPGALCSRR